MDIVDDEAFVAAIAAQQAVRDQVVETGCLHPFAFIWMTRDSEGRRLSTPSTRVIRPEPKYVTYARWNGHLIRDVRQQIEETDAAAVVLVALGFPPTAARHGVVSVHLETRHVAPRIWIAPMGCPRCGTPVGNFRDLGDHPDVPLLLPMWRNRTLN